MWVGGWIVGGSVKKNHMGEWIVGGSVVGHGSCLFEDKKKDLH